MRPGAVLLWCALAFTAAVDSCRDKDEFGCSYNGVCDAEGRCVCAAGWKGEQCEELDLLLAAGSGATFAGATEGLNLLSKEHNWTSSWGGSVAVSESGDEYFMVAPLMEYSCGINSWLQNSVVALATSRSPMGPYVVERVLFPAFSHEPVIARAPTGEFVVFYTTTAPLHVLPTNCNTCFDCTDGNSTMDCPPDWDVNGRNWSVPLPTYMSYSPPHDPRGQWSTPVLIPSANLGMDPMVDTNFAPVILSNGSLVGVTRSSIVHAHDWKNPASYHAVAGIPAKREDPSVWRDAKGRFHILTHSECGKHWFSADGTNFHGATVDKQGCAFPPQASFTHDPATVFHFGRRERPHPILASDGHAVLALSTAVTQLPTKWVGHPKKLDRWPDASFTLVQGVRQRG